MRVLVIEDGEGLGRIVGKMLTPEHEVALAPDGRSALALLREYDGYGAVVCGASLPDMGGDDLYAELLRSHAPLAARVVFVASGTLNPVSRRFLMTVAERVVMKPFGLAELCAGIAKAIKAP